jgi:DNA-binding CsgD family transcriptional regulator
MRKRVALLTIGQAPRPEVTSEILALVAEPVDVDEFGALDGLSAETIAAHLPQGDERPLSTRLASGDYVIVSDTLIVLLTTGVFQDLTTSTPLLHGQRAIDAWIGSLVFGECQIGVIFPLKQQLTEPYPIAMHGTIIQNASAAAYSGETDRLEEAATLLNSADLILMHSVGYTEEMARQLARATNKPVVTARRVIAGALRLRLLEPKPPGGAFSGKDLLARLPPPEEKLTDREREVLTLVLDGHSNKVVARMLDISYRTVEIHRGRGIGKFGASSAAELVRWALMGPRS